MNQPQPSSIASEGPTEKERWEQEVSRNEREFSLRQRELTARETEVQLKKLEHAQAGWRNPLVLSIVAAAVAGVFNAFVTWTNGRQQHELEDQKSESARILEMIRTGNAESANTNLMFLLEAGLVSSPDTVARLTAYQKKRAPNSGPSLPPVSGASGTAVDHCEQLEGRSIAIEATGHNKIVYKGTVGPNGIALAKAGNFLTESVYPWEDKDGKPLTLHDRTSGLCKDNTITMTRQLIDKTAQVFIGRLDRSPKGDLEMKGTFPLEAEAFPWHARIVDATK